jgi:hypothetical protein
MKDVSDRDGSFGQRHFGHCDLGDPRRTRRLVQAADQILAHPDKTLPNKFARPADYRAVLRLANRPQVTHQVILQAHAQGVLDWLRHDGPDVVVLPEDTTELDYSGQDTLVLGPIGNGGGQGYECHNTLAVDPHSRQIFGLLDQILHRRRRVPKGEGTKAKRDHPDRESRLWLKAAANIGQAPEGKRWIRVCDRGADSFEYLEYMVLNRLPFVFRSCQNRALQVEDEHAGPHLLHDYLRTLPQQATWSVTVSAQAGQPARTAVVWAAAAWVRVQAPQVHSGSHGKKPHAVWAIRVWEPDPPAGVERLEWFLLTDQEADDQVGLRVVVGYYECRPVVEEFHKGQKTGVGIESLQLQSRAGLEPLIALLSVVAVALVNLRIAARQPEQAPHPAREWVDPLWVRVLSVWRYKEERDLSVLEFTLALARLGGHQNRKCDGLPGWQTLWRGWERLRTMLDYELSRLTCGKH